MNLAFFKQKNEELKKHLPEGSEIITCIDSHTGGEPTRFAISGLPEIKGDNIKEKAKFFQENYDYLRTALTQEPRGRKAMHALILCSPTNPEADFGIIITCALGYLGMCGHGLIGIVDTAIETGIIEPNEPETKVNVETPSGLMKVRAQVSNRKVEGVTFRNQPALVYQEDLNLNLDPYGSVKVDIAYGGNWYAVVNVDQLGLEIRTENLDKFSKANNLILEAINEKITPEHPELELEDKVSQLVFVGPPQNPKADSMNLVTSQELGYDRSPCGTGSSAKMAALYSKGEIGLNEEYIHESGTTGSLFSTQLVEETTIKSTKAVVPEVTGYSYITGVNYVTIDPNDSFKHGFSIKE